MKLIYHKTTRWRTVSGTTAVAFQNSSQRDFYRGLWGSVMKDNDMFGVDNETEVQFTSGLLT